MKRLLYWLLQGTKGGPTRILLLRLLMEKPMNMRQLSLAAGLDYKTTEHHVLLLLKNSVLEGTGNSYGRIFFVSEGVLAENTFAELIRGVTDERKKRKA